MSRRHGDRLPVALVGFGGSGAGIHLPLIAAHPRLSLDVIVARSPEHVREARSRCPDAHVTSDLTAAGDCALVVVAVPPAYRAGTVGQLLGLGARVVVEKPMAANTDEAAILSDSDRLTVFQNRRWDSDFLTLQRLWTEATRPEPARLVSRLQWWQPTVRDGWRNRPEGGGILLEVGSHLIDQAIVLLGPVTAVYAELDVRRRDAVAEDDVFLALRHGDGSRSHLSMGPVGNARLPRFEVTTADTRIVLGAADPQQQQLAQGMAPADDGWGIPDTSDWSIQHGSEPPLAVRGERGRWQAFYDAVVNWAAAGGGPPVRAEEGIATMKVIDAARRSMEESRLIALGEGMRSDG
ncbi:Gfo/Idh/MocA family oxidoreductase [Streptomyces sp. NPDC101776]|uniref:Gfo/Idh/MocA family oxidoreductase n=1 Tax=Streptomyces sp. NPDC101776 TaxID=3366146 RepID=UPI00381097E4